MTFSQPLRPPFERWLVTVEDGLGGARAGDPGAVQRCLDATRTLRELLRLCRSEVPRGHVTPARRELRRMTRALARVAAIDRIQDLVADLEPGRGLEVSLARRLTNEIASQRHAAQSRLAHRLAPGPVRRLERELADVARGLGLREQSDGWVHSLAARTEHRVRRLRTVVAAVGGLYDLPRIARVGVAARKLRLALSLAADTGQAMAAAEAAEVARVTALIARWIDHARLLRIVGHLAPAGVSSSDPRLESLRVAIDATCRALHGRYVSQQPALLRAAVRAEAYALGLWVERGGRPPEVPLIAPRGRAVKMSAARGTLLAEAFNRSRPAAPSRRPPRRR